MTKDRMHIFRSDTCVTFRRVADPFGGLSNMAGGYPIRVGDRVIRSSEALYQACKFPHSPDLQELIFLQMSPLLSKRCIAGKGVKERDDWPSVAVDAMIWSVTAKLYCNKKFADLIDSTGELTIVEDSWNNAIWGAIPNYDGTLRGQNKLGFIMMKLRDMLRSNPPKKGDVLSPPSIPNFTFSGIDVPLVECNWSKEE